MLRNFVTGLKGWSVRSHGQGPRRKCTRLAMYLLLLAIIGAAGQQASAEVASDQEMRQVCENMLAEVVAVKGAWAESSTPTIREVTDIRMGDTVLAHIYAVDPRGYVLVPTLKEMVPIKAYSEESNLDEKQEGGFLALITEMLSDRARTYVRLYGSLDAEQPSAGEALFGRGQKETWGRYTKPTREFLPQVAGMSAEDEAGPLLTSSWHQREPYNNDCPMGSTGRCVVGCVATATAQIMNYWQHPAYGVGSHTYTWEEDNSCDGYWSPGAELTAYYSDTYDWAHMPDSCDEGCSSADSIALAELNYEVGVAFEMMYGACGSGAYVTAALGVFSTYYKYSPEVYGVNRYDYDQAEWYGLIKDEIDAGRPIQYRINRHSIVCDGYRDTQGFYEYHMNYGWGGAYTTWFVMDSLFCYWVEPDSVCPYNEEYMVLNIKPQTTPILTEKSFNAHETSGDSDGHADPGETLSMAVRIKNSGWLAENTVGTLSTDDPYVGVTVTGAAFSPAIDWGEEDTTQTRFEVSIDPGCPDPHVAQLYLDYTADGGYTSRDTILLFIGDTPGFSDNMESGVGSWSHESGTPGYVDEWHLSDQSSYYGTYSWKAGSSGPYSYADHNDACLITPPFLLEPGTKLRYYQKYQTESGWDGGLVMIDTGGASWFQIYPEGGYGGSLSPGSTSPFEDGTQFFTGMSGWLYPEYERVTFDLSAYSGVVRLMFRFGSDGNTNDLGWYIDNVTIKADNTFVGTPSVVEPVPGCVITFENVTGPGVTQVSTHTDNPVPPETPYRPIPADPLTYYNITTTASFTGSVEICMEYNEDDVAFSEENVVLLAIIYGYWYDQTTFVDTSANIICGAVSSLYSSANYWIAEKGCCLPPTVGDIDQSGVVDISDIQLIIDNQFITLTPLDCEAEGDVDFSGVVDVSDIQILIDNQFITLTPLPPCP